MKYEFSNSTNVTSFFTHKNQNVVLALFQIVLKLWTNSIFKVKYLLGWTFKYADSHELDRWGRLQHTYFNKTSFNTAHNWNYLQISLPCLSSNCRSTLTHCRNIFQRHPVDHARNNELFNSHAPVTYLCCLAAVGTTSTAALGSEIAYRNVRPSLGSCCMVPVLRSKWPVF